MRAPSCSESAKKKWGRLGGLPRFCGKFVRTCRKKLELQAQTKLHLTRRVALGAELTPARRAAHLKSRIGELHVVQSVEAEELELRAESLGEPDVLAQAHIQVPVGQAADRANTGILTVKPQNRSAEGGIRGSRVSEDVGTSTVVMNRAASGIRRCDLQALLVVEEVGAVTRTKRLGIAVGVAVEWQAAARGEDGG